MENRFWISDRSRTGVGWAYTRTAHAVGLANVLCVGQETISHTLWLQISAQTAAQRWTGMLVRRNYYRRAVISTDRYGMETLYPSVKDAAAAAGVRSCQISTACVTGYRCAGRRWRYAEDADDRS